MTVKPEGELHRYFHNVLETGHQGPCRSFHCDRHALNDMIEKHAPRVAHLMAPQMKKKVLPAVEEKVTVHNHLGNVTFQCFVRTPNNLNDLVQIMAKAKQENLNVKAVGSFHAWSRICVTSGYLVKTDNLSGTTRTPTGTLKDPSKADGLYDVLGGTKLKDAISVLEQNGRALMNLGGFTGQGIVGATATGTHGSGLKIPPLASMIRAVHLVSAKFDTAGLPIQYRIEPTNGITKPVLHTGPVVLVQDDKTFNAVITGLGAFGVIYSVTIDTVPFYWVRQLRQLVDWPTAKQLLQQGPTGDILKYNNSEVWLNPYTSLTLLTKREKVTTPPPTAQLRPPNENKTIFTLLLQELPALKDVKTALDNDEDVHEGIGSVLAVFLKNFPLLVPAAIDIALTTQNHAEPKVAKYYEIYDIGSVNMFPAVSTEISYPLTTYISATDTTLHTLEKLRTSDISSFIAGLISLRFTAPTPTLLSMSYNADSSLTSGRCYSELLSLFEVFDSIQGFDEIFRPVSEQSVASYQGRIHWGQYFTPSFQASQYKPKDPDFYANIVQFKSILQKYDPGRLMANDFLEKHIYSAT